MKVFNIVLFSFGEDLNLLSSVLVNVNEFKIKSACPDLKALMDFIKDSQYILNNQIDVLLYDGTPNFDKPFESILKEMRKIRQSLPETKIILISEFNDSRDIFSAIRFGASGILEKSSSSLEMIESLRILTKGGAPVSHEIIEKIFQHFALSNTNPLTDREMEILELLANGYTFWKIAETVDVNVETVKTHVRHIYDKLDVSCKMEALDVAKANRLIV